VARAIVRDPDTIIRGNTRAHGRGCGGFSAAVGHCLRQRSGRQVLIPVDFFCISTAASTGSASLAEPTRSDNSLVFVGTRFVYVRLSFEKAGARGRGFGCHLVDAAIHDE
jgi:hypothetical protein